MTTADVGEMPRRWFVAGGHEALWGRMQSTYQGVEAARLPPLSTGPELLFAQLAQAPVPSDPLGSARGGDWHQGKPLAERLAPLLAEAARLGLTAPPEFLRFMTSPELIQRVPSCTACYVDVPNRLVELPGHPGRLLRFLNDQQVCVLWYLHLTPDGGHSVVCVLPEIVDGDALWLDDAIALRETMRCADSFTEFLHRFWLENALWFALNANKPLTPEQQAYVDAVQRSR